MTLAGIVGLIVAPHPSYFVGDLIPPRSAGNKGATPSIKGAAPKSKTEDYSVVFPAALALAHRAVAEAEIAALQAALLLILSF